MKGNLDGGDSREKKQIWKLKLSLNQINDMAMGKTLTMKNHWHPYLFKQNLEIWDENWTCDSAVHYQDMDE